jgi:hypothetical protein
MGAQAAQSNCAWQNQASAPITATATTSFRKKGSQPACGT